MIDTEPYQLSIYSVNKFILYPNYEMNRTLVKTRLYYLTTLHFQHLDVFR